MPAAWRWEQETATRPRIRWGYEALLALAIAAAGSLPLFASGTNGGAAWVSPATDPLVAKSGDGDVTFGDYVHAAFGGLPFTTDKFERYGIEVPPGTAQLDIDLFDGDTGDVWDNYNGGGNGPPGEPADEVLFEVYDPQGTLVLSITEVPMCGGLCDDAWRNLYGTPNPMPGHWLLTVDACRASGGVCTVDNGGTDYHNTYGLRAHDGDPGAGGTELLVYAHSHLVAGQLDLEPIPTMTIFPYVTSGCFLSENNFDGDGRGDQTLTTRLGTAYVLPNGGNGDWLTNAITGWASPDTAIDYGMWTEEITFGPFGPGNTLTYYLADDQAAPTPPLEQPEPSTIRLYLQRDGGGAPSKPYLTQQLTHLAGPNPPVDGVTSFYTVTITVVNPTANPITFSQPTNLVSARVPGGAVLYQGAAAVSQGTIVSQPPLLGSGNIQWDPGTVLPTTTAGLSYQIEATPPGPGTLDVTGAGAATGSRALFIDEACSGAAPACTGAQLAAATYGTGGICELSIEPGTPTYATIGGLSLQGETLTFTTAGELGSAAFRVLRRSDGASGFEPVHDGWLPALVEAHGGGTYRVAVPAGSETPEEAPAEDTVTEYAIVERDLAGVQRWQGPYRPSMTVAGADATASRLGAQPAPPTVSRSQRTSKSARLPSARSASSESSASPARLRLVVRRSGLQALSAEALAQAFAMTIDEVRARLGAGQWRLVREGQEVAWAAGSSPDQLQFYGVANATHWAGGSSYLLEPAAGERMAERSATPLGSATTLQTFAARERTELDLFAGTAAADDPDHDFWFWAAASTDSPTDPLVVEAPEMIADGDTATLVLDLLGATPGEHSTAVTINGEDATAASGPLAWSGRGRVQLELEVPTGLLVPDANDITLRELAAESILYLDGIELRYQRRLHAASGSLEFQTSESGDVLVSGLSGPALELLSLDDPRRPVRVSGTVEPAADGSWKLRFAASGPERFLLWALPPEAPELHVVAEATLPSSGDAIDYLVLVGDPSLLAAAEELAVYRQSQGLSVATVLLQDVLDQLGSGDFDPTVVRAFIAQVGPTYTLLVGRGTYDYRDALGFGNNLLPAWLAATDHGLYASDARYGDGSGSDGVPETRLGRLPAASAAEVSNYLAKVQAFETEQGDMTSGWVTLLADAAAGGFDFNSASAILAERLAPRFDVEDIALDLEPLARERLFTALDRGTGWLNYVGHGGLTTLGSSGILTTSDLETLPDFPDLAPFADRPFLFTAQSCTVARFEVPQYRSLAEELLFEPGGGAAAVWAPSGVSYGREAAELMMGFALELTGSEPGTSRRLGDVVLAAIMRYRALQGLSATPAIFNLLGDPALLLRPPTPSAGGDDGGTSGDGGGSSPALLFRDGFESGDTSAWSGAAE